MTGRNSFAENPEGRLDRATNPSRVIPGGRRVRYTFLGASRKTWLYALAV